MGREGLVPMSAEPSARIADAIDFAVRQAVADAVRREREEIAKLLEEMTTEWRSVPSPESELRKYPEVSAGGVVVFPTTIPTPAEVWVLNQAARRVRARNK